MNNFDNRSIEIPCPKCSHKVKKTIGWLKRNNKMICASCGVASVLEAKKFLADIRRVEGKLNKF